MHRTTVTGSYEPYLATVCRSLGVRKAAAWPLHERRSGRGPELRGLERAPHERDHLALAAAQRRLALVLADHGVQHARLGERTHDRRVQHEQQERGVLLADLAGVHPRLEEIHRALPQRVDDAGEPLEPLGAE